MPFGIFPAPEEFQWRLNRALEGLEGFMPIFDDILIFGAGETEVTANLDHDQKLKLLLERCHSIRESSSTKMRSLSAKPK